VRRFEASVRTAGAGAGAGGARGRGRGRPRREGRGACRSPRAAAPRPARGGPSGSTPLRRAARRGSRAPASPAERDAAGHRPPRPARRARRRAVQARRGGPEPRDGVPQLPHQDDEVPRGWPLWCLGGMTCAHHAAACCDAACGAEGALIGGRADGRRTWRVRRRGPDGGGARAAAARARAAGWAATTAGPLPSAPCPFPNSTRWMTSATSGLSTQ
jgi:hypothetical protein